MAYAVKEVFRSICGEGFHAGRAATFVRLAGCNLWSGREADRASAACRFCDTDFLGGSRMTAAEVASAIEAEGPCDWVVFTGGEPALQLDDDLYLACRRLDADFAVETNGTRALPDWLDYVAVSPKAGVELVVRSGDELKVVYPQAGLDMEGLAGMRFTHRYVQPMDGPGRDSSLRACVGFVLANPAWRLSLQAHKAIGVR